MSALATVPDFRAWSGANTPASVPDALIQNCLDEAESGIVADLGVGIETVALYAPAIAIAHGEELRRASRLLARRNSPESIAGAGEAGLITIPSRDPDSARAIQQIKALLLIPEPVA